jgi:periodic tryptophan protein 2
VDATIPGATRGDASLKRTTMPEIRTKCIQFSPSGRAYAVASTEGLLIYSIDETLVFDPFELGEVRGLRIADL